MADIYGSNYQKEFVDVPSDQAAPGEYGGRVKCMYDSYAGATPGADNVYLGKIPSGARILRLSHVGGGTAPTWSVALDDKLTAEADLILTLDGDGAASGYGFCEYVLD